MAMLHRVIIDVDTGRVVRFQMPPDYHRATLGDNFSLRDLRWSPDSTKLAFISTARDHKQAVLRVADASTGAVRTVMDETAKTQYESRVGCGCSGTPTKSSGTPSATIGVTFTSMI
jgi:hypothetical protein